MAITPIIELQNISYNYSHEEKPVLKDLNFSIHSEKIGLIGPNGSGKTTLLHIIVGLIKPKSGTVLFRGVPVSSEEDFKPLRREVGFLFQSSDDQLFSPTVLEDVAFGPLNLGHSPEKSKDIGVETLAKLGLSGFENRLTHKLSGGEKKLVALATILAMDPKMLLLDEPTNNLDPKTQHHLQDILNDLQLPYIIISHDWDFLSGTTSQLYTLEHGHIHKCEEDHIHEHRHVHTYGDKPHHHLLKK